MELVNAVDCRGCSAGEAMCRIPCWGTPSDMIRVIRRGHGHQLEIVAVLLPDYRAIQLLVPSFTALTGARYHADDVTFPLFDHTCIFFDHASKLCAIHSIKPHEGRVACCRQKSGNSQQSGLALRDNIALTWRSPGAQRLVLWWKQKYAILFDRQDAKLRLRATQYVINAVLNMKRR